MLGAILGDMVGSPYEFDRNNHKSKDFPLLSERSHFTDDTVMTLAVARGLMAGQGDAQKTFAEVRYEMRRLGNVYPDAGYGGMFRRWLCAEHPEIRQYVEQTFGYDLSRTCDEIRPGYRHVETCQQTVPEAIIAFLESNSFEDALRNAVSLGGDSDTLACITGGIAEAFYGMPQELRAETLKRLPEDLRAAYELFRQNLERRM